MGGEFDFGAVDQGMPGMAAYTIPDYTIPPPVGGYEAPSPIPSAPADPGVFNAPAIPQAPTSPASPTWSWNFDDSGLNFGGNAVDLIAGSPRAGLQLDSASKASFEAPFTGIDFSKGAVGFDIGAKGELVPYLDTGDGKSAPMVLYDSKTGTLQAQASALRAYVAPKLGELVIEGADWGRGEDGVTAAATIKDSAELQAYAAKARSMGLNMNVVADPKNPQRMILSATPGAGNAKIMGNVIAATNAKAMLEAPAKGWADRLTGPVAQISAALLTQAGAYLIAEQGNQAAKKLQRQQLEAQLDLINASAVARQSGGGGGGSSSSGRGRPIYGGK